MIIGATTDVVNDDQDDILDQLKSKSNKENRNMPSSLYKPQNYKLAQEEFDKDSPIFKYKSTTSSIYR